MYSALEGEASELWVEQYRAAQRWNDTAPESQLVSSMLSWGRIGAALSFCGVIIFFLIEPLRAIAPALLGLFSFFVFSWMLGAIETRLIEINQTLLRQGRSG